MKKWVRLAYECDNCGDNLEVNTAMEQTSEFENYVHDGDEVRCKCGFESLMSIDEAGYAWVQDGNLAELNKET